MTLTSKILSARPGSKSLRATIPEGCVEYLSLKKGDTLEWEMESNTPRELLVRKSAK